MSDPDLSYECTYCEAPPQRDCDPNCIQHRFREAQTEITDLRDSLAEAERQLAEKDTLIGEYRDAAAYENAGKLQAFSERNAARIDFIAAESRLAATERERDDYREALETIRYMGTKFRSFEAQTVTQVARDALAALSDNRPEPEAEEP